jgi:hypothetical protein
MIRNIFIALSLLVLFYSCNTDSTSPQEQQTINDLELIQAIASAPDKESIELEQLPSVSQNVLNNDYSESYINDAKIAPQLGYEITTRREWGTHIGDAWPIYFDLKGRELRNERDSGEGHDYDENGHERRECFMLVYPVTFIMPDGTTITGEDEKTVCNAIKEWYEANPDSKGRPVLQYPVDVILRDSTTITVNNADEMHALKEDCDDWDRDDHGDHEFCFKLVYPVTYIMPDGSEITVEDDSDWAEIKSWYEVNPDSKERPELQYPVDVILKDSTTITVNNADEMHALKEDCDDWDRDDDKDHEYCFELVYPVTYIMPDGSEITVANDSDRAEIKSWYKANPDTKERPVLQYPVDVTLRDGTTITVNNADEMHALKEDCQDRDRHGHGDDDNRDDDGDEDGDGDGD